MITFFLSCINSCLFSFFFLPSLLDMWPQSHFNGPLKIYICVIPTQLRTKKKKGTNNLFSNNINNIFAYFCSCNLSFSFFFPPQQYRCSLSPRTADASHKNKKKIQYCGRKTSRSQTSPPPLPSLVAHFFFVLFCLVFFTYTFQKHKKKKRLRPSLHDPRFPSSGSLGDCRHKKKKICQTRVTVFIAQISATLFGKVCCL